jgi:hypothetical protein
VGGGGPARWGVGREGRKEREREGERGGHGVRAHHFLLYYCTASACQTCPGVLLGYHQA